jgi:hypothetical protein
MCTGVKHHPSPVVNGATTLNISTLGIMTIDKTETELSAECLYAYHRYAKCHHVE